MIRRMRASALVLVGLFGCVSDAPAMPDGGDSGPQDSPAGDQSTTSDVTGKVIDELGFPAPNVKLAIGSATTTTAADGTFKLSAPPTYDVALAYDSGTTTTN